MPSSSVWISNITQVNNADVYFILWHVFLEFWLVNHDFKQSDVSKKMTVAQGNAV